MKVLDAAPLVFAFVPIALFIGLIIICGVVAAIVAFGVKKVKTRREKESIQSRKEEKNANNARDNINTGE